MLWNGTRENTASPIAASGDVINGHALIEDSGFTSNRSTNDASLRHHVNTVHETPTQDDTRARLFGGGGGGGGGAACKTETSKQNGVKQSNPVRYRYSMFELLGDSHMTNGNTQAESVDDNDAHLMMSQHAREMQQRKKVFLETDLDTTTEDHRSVLWSH